MEKLVKQIVQYIDKEYSMNESEKDILRFGVESTIELGISLIVSILILWSMDMILEGMVFFVIFIPVRMLAGGYHSENYFYCLFLSSATLVIVMILSKYVHLAKELLVMLILLMELLIGMFGPIVNPERPVTKTEYIMFTKRLAKIFVLVAFVSIRLSVSKYFELLNVVFLSLCLVLCSSFVGKLKYRKDQI